jgi:hypothetical protein
MGLKKIVRFFSRAYAGGRACRGMLGVIIVVCFFLFFSSCESVASGFTEDLEINDGNVAAYEWVLLSSDHLPVALFGVIGGAAGMLVGSYYAGHFFLEGVSIAVNPKFDNSINRQSLGLAEPVLLPIILVIDAFAVVGSVVSSVPSFGLSVLSGHVVLYSNSLFQGSLCGVSLSNEDKLVLRNKIEKFRGKANVSKDEVKIYRNDYRDLSNSDRQDFF